MIKIGQPTSASCVGAAQPQSSACAEPSARIPIGILGGTDADDRLLPSQTRSPECRYRIDNFEVRLFFGARRYITGEKNFCQSENQANEGAAAGRVVNVPTRRC
jgi:hypothetical protein